MSSLQTSNLSLASSFFDLRRLKSYLVLSILFWLATILLIAVVVAFLGSIYRNYAASVELEKKYAALRAAGEVFDAKSMEAQYLAKTTTAHREEWIELLGVAASRWSQDILTAQAKFNIDSRPLASPVDEAERRQLVELLEELAPVVERMRILAATAAPLRFHDDPRGIWNDMRAFSSVRAGARLMSLDFRYAVSQNDRTRALDDWKAILGCRKLFVDDSDMVHGMVANAIEGIGRFCLRQSLQSDFWTVEQLKTFATTTAIPMDVSRSWRNMMAGERALLHRYFIERLDPSLSEDSKGMVQRWSSLAELRLMNHFENIASAGDHGFDQLERRCKAVQREFEDDRGLDWTSLLLRSAIPHYTGFVNTLRQKEDDRRWTSTAIGLRQFKQQNGRFPVRLVELESVGLKPSDWTTISSGEFGYSRLNGAAILWTYDPNLNSNHPEYRKILASPIRERNDDSESHSNVMRLQ